MGWRRGKPQAKPIEAEPIEAKRHLASLEAASTAFRDTPKLRLHLGNIEVEYEYPSGDEWVRAGLRFERAAAYRGTSETHCTLWQVEGTYDHLVEVTPSTWLNELARAFETHDDGIVRLPVHHYMIYIDDLGCLEVAAQGWSWLTPRKATP